ncbi:intraflagellar transport protein 80 homolog isoform X3 [Daktulosphaira vitifoliae]|uniref:intraflagellar transport protein 80 homolog isoform X3 n=1 Tax=Daktulosphaira vitifoliae TaxID=58002 RepID=UPI0021A98581|nr:intraflagellar transport protein 80 homolog isoform X3 [Daktulosphaira vitifoliae]
MRLKSTISEDNISSSVECISWIGNYEILVGRDDCMLYKWNQTTREQIKLCSLPENSSPIDLDVIFTNQRQANKVTGSEQILLTSSNGSLHLMNKPTKIDKSIEAHEGNILVGKWSADGSTLFTAGEDGSIKIWSRIGMLRTKLVVNGEPIISADWNCDSSKIVYTQHDSICIKSLKPNVKSIRVRGHDGIILTVSWCKANDIIVSGGEDCCYKIWDSYGNSVYVSEILKYPVTSTSWKADGKLLLIGSFNTILLCNRYGVIQSINYTDCGSIRMFSWSPDNTQIAAACADGKLLISTIINRYFSIFMNSAVNVYSYDGKLVSSPKWPNMQCDRIQENYVSMSSKLLAIRDQLNDKMVNMCEVVPSNLLPVFKHESPINSLQLMNTKDKNYLAIIDSNLNICVIQVEKNDSYKMFKLGSMFNGMSWNEQLGSLAALQYTNLIVWYDPLLLLNDPILTRKSIEKIDLSIYGSNLEIESFEDNLLNLTNEEGIRVTVQISPYLESLKSFISKSKWMECRTLCRSINNEALWAVLAGYSVLDKQLDTAEECFISIGYMERASFIQHLRKSSDRTINESSLALLCGNLNEAETILLRSGSTLKAIMFNIKIHQWVRALELALKHKRFLNVVINERRKYLELFKKPENNEKFLKYSDVVVDDDDETVKEVEKEILYSTLII